MTKHSLFRSLGDEIRRFWLAQPPQRRTAAATGQFSSALWALGLQAGSNYERHQEQVLRVIRPLVEMKPESAPNFEL